MKINKDDFVKNLLDNAIKCIVDKKGKNIVSLHFSPEQTSICDYFLICEAINTKQAQAITDFIHYKIKEKKGLTPAHIEGYETAKWILMDYLDVIIHIFLPDARQFYGLEKLWADAEIKNYN